MPSLNDYHDHKNDLKIKDSNNVQVRAGWRSYILDEYKGKTLSHLIGGQLPYYYRSPYKIADEFKARHNAIEMFFDLAVKMPTTDKFQRSHCGEILCAIYLEDILGLKRLFSKLTLTTAEDTNVHKMDGFFVDSTVKPFSYYAVEAKCSILPTGKTKFSGHRHGILKQMINSLEGYDENDQRFDFTAIRDNLESGNFTEEECAQIRKDLIPPGPNSLTNLGVAAINVCTVDEKDDDFILSEPCSKDFQFFSIVVNDMANLATDSYSHWKK